MLMKAGVDLARQFRLPKLRFASSVGEPLNPEAVVWGEEAIGLPFHDNWWQTETGGIMIANFASMDIKAGSMGKPVPGVEAAIVRASAAGEIEEIGAPGVTGEGRIIGTAAYMSPEQTEGKPIDHRTDIRAPTP